MYIQNYNNSNRQSYINKAKYLLFGPFPITVILIAINVIIFVIWEIVGANVQTLVNWGAETPYTVLVGKQYYRLFNSMFLHFSPGHIGGNMLMLYVLGIRLEPIIGSIRFFIIYIIGGIGGNIVSLYLPLILGKGVNANTISAGASGAVFAVMGAIVYIAIRNRGRFVDLGIRQIGFLVLINLYIGYLGNNVDNLAHLGGVVFGFILGAILGNTKKMRRNKWR